MDSPFTEKIIEVLNKNFGNNAKFLYSISPILKYINEKTRSVNRGSKARGSFGNLYAIYVLVEDYIKKGFNLNDNYKNYEGAKFSVLFNRQRELPFGEKLQNHALNHRLNQEFKKYFPTCEHIPILRDVDTNRYWFNENLLKIETEKGVFNISKSIIEIINIYIEIKRESFNKFIEYCEKLKSLPSNNQQKKFDFIINLLNPNVDARIFEIVSFCIMKYYYHDQIIYWGFDLDDIQEENLKLYKTGRTNANDGGIDFVMKPLGRFFQVTETTDVKKYFLDIDKIERYPITFVIKSDEEIEVIKSKIKLKAEKQYSITTIVEKYMSCIEEIINLPTLINLLHQTTKNEYLPQILDEIIKQSKVEFYYEE